MGQQDGSADLFANFAGVMVLLVAVLMTAVNVKESLINIQNKRASDKQEQLSPDKQSLSLLEVAYGQSGQPLFYWQKSEKDLKQSFRTYEGVRKAIKTGRPDGIRLRIDNRVSSGVYKKILAQASTLDIAIYQSDRQE